MKWRLFTVLSTGALSISLAGLCAAQAAEVNTGATRLAESQCEVENRSSMNIANVIATPTSNNLDEPIKSFAANRTTDFVLPPGESLNEPDSGVITAMLVEYYACLAADNQLAAASFWTDDWLRAQVVTEWSTVEAAQDAATPTPTSELVLGSRMQVRSLRSQEGPYAAALVELQFPNGQERKDAILIQHVENRWLVAGVLSGVTVANEAAP